MPLSVRTFIGEVEQCLVAIPGIAKAGYTLDLALDENVVGRWNEQQAER